MNKLHNAKLNAVICQHHNDYAAIIKEFGVIKETKLTYPDQIVPRSRKPLMSLTRQMPQPMTVWGSPHRVFAQYIPSEFEDYEERDQWIKWCIKTKTFETVDCNKKPFNLKDLLNAEPCATFTMSPEYLSRLSDFLAIDKDYEGGPIIFVLNLKQGEMRVSTSYGQNLLPMPVKINESLSHLTDANYRAFAMPAAQIIQFLAYFQMSEPIEGWFTLMGSKKERQLVCPDISPIYGSLFLRSSNKLAAAARMGLEPISRAYDILTIL